MSIQTAMVSAKAPQVNCHRYMPAKQPRKLEKIQFAEPENALASHRAPNIHLHDIDFPHLKWHSPASSCLIANWKKAGYSAMVKFRTHDTHINECVDVV